jgi:hypothetical protein
MAVSRLYLRKTQLIPDTIELYSGSTLLPDSIRLMKLAKTTLKHCVEKWWFTQMWMLLLKIQMEIILL